jgi:hypothetical protein
LLIVVAFGLMTGGAVADIVFDHLEFEADQVPITLLVIPDGSGPGFADARRDDGTPWGRPFRVRPWFRVWGGPDEPVPLPGYPAEDVWLGTVEGGVPCVGSGHPDAASDAEGWFTWSAPLAAGGAMAQGDLVLVLAGMTPEEVLPVRCVSPDLVADDEVDLSDMAAFVAALGAGDATVADFNSDGLVNLSDVALFAPAIGAECP